MLIDAHYAIRFSAIITMIRRHAATPHYCHYAAEIIIFFSLSLRQMLMLLSDCFRHFRC